MNVAGASIEVSKKSEEVVSPNMFVAWLMVLLGGVFYSYQFVLRVSVGMMTDELIAAFNIDATFLGFFSSCYYLSYSIFLIPLGIMMDRIGPRSLFTICSILLGMGCFLFANTANAYVACFGRLMIGAGAACGFLGALKLGSLWLPPAMFGKAVALTIVFGTLGAILGETPLEYCINSIGWRMTLNYLGLFGILLSGFLFVVIRNNDSLLRKQREEAKKARKGFSTFQHVLFDLRLILSSKQAWMVAMYSMLMYIPMTIVGDLWGVSFVERVFGIEETLAASVISTMFIGVAVGSPLFVLFSDWLQRRKITLFVAAFLCLVTYLLIIYSNSLSLYSMYFLFFCAGFFFGGKSIGFAVVVESLPARVSGIAVGFANTVIMLNGVISLPLVGALLDFGKTYHFPSDLHFEYTVDNFRFAFTLIPLSLFLAFLSVFWVKESYPKN